MLDFFSHNDRCWWSIPCASKKKGYIRWQISPSPWIAPNHILPKSILREDCLWLDLPMSAKALGFKDRSEPAALPCRELLSRSSDKPDHRRSWSDTGIVSFTRNPQSGIQADCQLAGLHRGGVPLFTKCKAMHALCPPSPPSPSPKEQWHDVTQPLTVGFHLIPVFLQLSLIFSHHTHFNFYSLMHVCDEPVLWSQRRTRGILHLPSSESQRRRV